MSEARLDTQVIHAGEPRPRLFGAAVVPIFQSSVFEHRGGGSYAGIPYPRLSNLPNHDVLARKLAALERSEDAVVCSSGMAAISAAVLGVLRHGDHLLVQDCLYGGTQGFFGDELQAFGIACEPIATDDPKSWSRQVRANTRAIYVEAITNPLMQVIDHRAVTALARQRGLVSIIDATFATPVNFRPIEHGYDLAVHSATKYLNGHSDLAAGAAVGSTALIDKVKKRLSHLGGSLDPHACFLLHRGLRTLALRVRQQNRSALEIAGFLAARKEVARVHYPGLESDRYHRVAKELFEGFGGMLAFELRGGAAAAEKLLDHSEIALCGPSLGGVETLLSIPAKLSHLGLSPEERARMGVTDGLIRMSVGIEATEDLIADLERALGAR